MKFEYSNVKVENDPADMWSIDFDLTLDGDTYQVSYEWTEPDSYGNTDGTALAVTLEDVDQYWEPDPGPNPFGAGKDRDTHFSRVFDQDELGDWIQLNILEPIWEAQREAIRKMNGASGTVEWEGNA